MLPLSCLNTWEYVLQLPGDVLVPKGFRALPFPAGVRNQQVGQGKSRKEDKDGRGRAGVGPSRAPSFLGSDCPFKATARLPLAMTSAGARCWSRNSKANFC